MLVVEITNWYLCLVKIVWGRRYLCTWHILKAWCLHLMEKIKENGVQHAILDYLHIVMYMPIEPSENIEVFMTHG